MEEKIKSKPKIKMYFICGLVPDIIPILLPNINNVLKFHLFLLFPAISFTVYFIKLELYGKWSENYISNISFSYNKLLNRHTTLKKEYKKQCLLISKHETISSRFIDTISRAVLECKGKEQLLLKNTNNVYQDIKQDELGKYNRKDDF